MRVSVAARGVAASTFDLVARTAGVSRGLLHYYFGTKERLLVEVVRREAEVRIARLDESITDARNADEVLDALVRSFEDFLGEGPATPVMVYELISLAQRNGEISTELAELSRRTRCHLADALKEKNEAGVVELGADPDTVAAFLFAIADGLTMRRMSDPDYDIGPVLEQGVAAARALLR
jgi:AcrR family transcriptional regulator